MKKCDSNQLSLATTSILGQPPSVEEAMADLKTSLASQSGSGKEV